MTLPQARPTAVQWRAVITFFLLACAWSWPLFWLRDMHPEAWRALALPHPLKNMLLMWGPGLAALVCLRLFRQRHSRTITFAGAQRLRALAFYFVPMALLALAGVHMPEFGGRVHAFVGVLAVIGLLNMLGEELGWRGFLQDALRPLARLPRYSLIGLMWAGWHFTNLFAGRSSGELLVYLAWYLPLTILLSALIGEATDRARAVVVAVTLHGWVNLLWEFQQPAVWAVFAVSLPFWGWLLWRWPGQPESAAGVPHSRVEPTPVA